MEWTTDERSNKIHVGTAALHLNPQLPFKLTWPFQRGTFNSRDYGHVREVIEDLGQLWRGTIIQELQLNSDDFGKYCVVLVLPDSFDRAQVKECVEALMSNQRPFRAVTVIQESQAVTFGCGVSSGVVVDCGAQKISISCVEEGFLVPETKIKIPVGGDDITRLFSELLKLHEFPHEFDLKNPLDWKLLDELKERCCTVNEAEIAPSAAIFEFYVRKPEELTRKFLFKMFEERIIPPLTLFDDKMGQFSSFKASEEELNLDSNDLEDDTSTAHNTLHGTSEDVPSDSSLIGKSPVKCFICNEKFEDGISIVLEHFNSVHSGGENTKNCPTCSFTSNDKISMECHIISHFVNVKFHQETILTAPKLPIISKLKETFNDPMALDDAIIDSLLKLAETERIKRCSSSIILSGGSHLFSGFPDVLSDNLSKKLPLNPLTALIEAKIFPNSRDLDARFLAWKGGCVFSKLESTASDAWITREDWNNFGTRSIKDKISFIN